jgi:hypothetical protein
MHHLLHSITAAVAQGNWYAALSTALAVPDICGWLEDPSAGSQTRYVAWFDRFVGPEYIHEIGPDRDRHVFLSGRDCYALRCAFLHEGREEIASQRARDALDRFQFTVAPPTWTVHCNLLGAKLQLQVDIFCAQIVNGAEHWLAEVSTQPDVAARMPSLLRIYDVNGTPIN